MWGERDGTELKQFYDRWASHLLLFCRLYTGDIEAAEHAVARAFLGYFRSELPLLLDHLPTALMSFALEESDDSGDPSGTGGECDFESAMLRLPADERAVFILHGTLEMQLPWVAAITRLQFAAVNQLWIRALLHMRLYTVKDACSQLFEDCSTAPKPEVGARA